MRASQAGSPLQLMPSWGGWGEEALRRPWCHAIPSPPPSPPVGSGSLGRAPVWIMNPVCQQAAPYLLPREPTSTAEKPEGGVLPPRSESSRAQPPRSPGEREQGHLSVPARTSTQGAREGAGATRGQNNAGTWKGPPAAPGNLGGDKFRSTKTATATEPRGCGGSPSPGHTWLPSAHFLGQVLPFPKDQRDPSSSTRPPLHAPHCSLDSPASLQAPKGRPSRTARPWVIRTLPRPHALRTHPDTVSMCLCAPGAGALRRSLWNSLPSDVLRLVRIQPLTPKLRLGLSNGLFHPHKN